MSVIDFSKMLSTFESGWIAVSPEGKKLVGQGKTLQEAVTKAKKAKVSNPIVFKVGKFGSNMAG
jgi:hypothetical protein